MFGGAAHEGALMRAAKRPRSPFMSRPVRVALLTSAFVAVAVGLALDGAVRHDLPQDAVRTAGQVLVAAASVLAFGAGLLQLATWRISHRASLGCRGGALAVCGLTVALLTQLR